MRRGGAQVTQHLDGAFRDERGRDRKPKEARRATVDEVATAKINSGSASIRSPRKDCVSAAHLERCAAGLGLDEGASKAELLKAYKEAEHYRREAKRLRGQLDQFANSCAPAPHPPLMHPPW
jgi:hypothetical protein